MDYEKLFWIGFAIVAIWAALTPGRQLRPYASPYTIPAGVYIPLVILLTYMIIR